MRRMQTIVALAAAYFTAQGALGARPARVKDPKALVAGKYAEITKVVESTPDRGKMTRAIEKVMDTFVDYRELGRRALKGHWKGLRRKQRKQFVDGFKKMIQRTYVKRFNPDRRVEIEYLGETEIGEDGSAKVKTVVHSGKSEARVDYLFHEVRGKWMAFDVIIDDVSMVKNYRRQFHRIIEREGFDGLMDRIRRKNAKAEAAAKAGGERQPDARAVD